MRHLFFTLLFSITLVTAFAQSKHVTLIIDKLELVGKEEDQSMRVYITNQGFANLGDAATKVSYHPDHQPNYTARLKLDADSSNVHIRMDENDGYLKIKGLYNYKGDTLRIAHFKQYRRLANDTTSRKTIYYITHGGDSLEPYKAKLTTIVDRAKKAKHRPKRLFLLINGIDYVPELQLMKGPEEITMGSGYLKKDYQKHPEKYIGKKSYFHFQSRTVRYYSVAEIDVSNLPP